jgi:hypothetical protein
MNYRDHQKWKNPFSPSTFPSGTSPVLQHTKMLLLFIYLKDEELISNILWEKSWLYYNISKGMLCSIVNREKVVLSYEFWKKTIMRC